MIVCDIKCTINDNLIISKYKNIINNIESDINFESPIYTFPVNFLNFYNNYKINLFLLLDDSNFFYNYLDILNNDKNEEIYINEHCETIYEYINFTNIFNNLIKKGVFNQYITFVQYKIAKLIVKKINNIWYSEYYLNKIINVNKNKLPSKKELHFFFNIIEIIYYKIHIDNQNIDLAIKNNNLLNNDYYLDIINKEKMFYKNQFNLLNKI
jgi:hypothetical protein